MGTKTPKQLLADWKLEKISTEQAIGYILQNIIRLEHELHELNNSMYQLIKRSNDNENTSK